MFHQGVACEARGAARVLPRALRRDKQVTTIGTSAKFCLSQPLRRRPRATAAAMAKSKNHTSHNQSNKAHKNGADSRKDSGGLDDRCRPTPARRCAASVCPLTPPCLVHASRHQEAEDVQVLFDQGGASGPPNGRPAAPLPLPPRQPTTRCSNAFHAGWAARMRRQRWRLAPACPDPSSCLMP